MDSGWFRTIFFVPTPEQNDHLEILRVFSLNSQGVRSSWQQLPFATSVARLLYFNVAT